MKKEDLDLAGYLLGQDYRKQTDIENHSFSNSSIDQVFDQQAKKVTCPACSCEFNPLIATCPECGLQFS